MTVGLPVACFCTHCWRLLLPPGQRQCVFAFMHCATRKAAYGAHYYPARHGQRSLRNTGRNYPVYQEAPVTDGLFALSSLQIYLGDANMGAQRCWPPVLLVIGLHGCGDILMGFYGTQSLESVANQGVCVCVCVWAGGGEGGRDFGWHTQTLLCVPTGAPPK